MDRKTLEQNYQKSIGASPAAELEQNYQRSGIDSLVQAVKKATQYNPSAPSTQPKQAAPAGASSRKQSDAMKEQLDTIKKQRDDAAIKAGAYMRAGNMPQQAKEQQKIANKAAIEYENAYTQWKNQRNAEAVEDYNPDENKFKAGDAALAGVQNAFQSMRQYAAAASSYLSGNPEAQAWEAKRLMESGVSGTEAVKRAGLADKREIPITDYKTQAELRHEKNVASVGAVEGGALQLVNTISNMVPSLVANAVLPGSGLPMMAASAAGNKYADAYEKYGNTDTAFVLGSAAGGASMLTEQFGGLYGSLGKSAAGQAVAKKLMAEAPGLYNLANSVGGKWMRDALSEGIEEGAEDVINYAIEKALTGDSDEMDNFGYDILLGALAGGVLGGGNAAMRSVTYSRVGKALNASPAAVAQQVREGMEKGAGTAPAIYAAEVQKNPSSQMVGRLYEANLTFDAESGLSKIQNDITQVSINEIKAMVSKADALAQAAQKLNVEATPQAVATAITDAQRTQSIKTAEDSVGQAFAPTVDNPANAGEKAYNSALAGVAANQGVAARINNDPAARQAFSQLTGVQFSGNTAQDIAAIEVATQNIAKSGKQAISQAEYAQRVAAAGEQAAAQFDADMQAQAEQMQRESDERWLSVEQNTITDVDGKRRIKEITNTDVRGNTEIGYKKAEILGSKKKAVAEVNNAAKYLGKTIVWFEGAVQVNGQYRLTNGYRAPDGTIYVNINSRDPLMVTFGHEMFHDLVADSKYSGLIDTLVENPDYADMVKGMMDAKTELYERNGIELDPNAAAEEVAADISGDLLGSRDMLEYIGARNTEAATGIKGFLNRILKKLKGKPSAQEAYNRLSESQKALLDGMEGKAETGVNTLHLVDNATKKAVVSQGPQTLGSSEPITASEMGSNSFSADMVPQSDTAVNNYSMQNSAEGALLDSSKVKIVGNGDVDIALPEGYEDIGIAVTGEGSAAPNRYSLMSFRESELGTDKVKYATRLAKATGVSVQLATDWINSVYSVAAIIGDDKARLDYEANRNNTSLKPNSEYDFSLDFSTLCAKRLLFSGTMDAIQSALPNTPLTSEDFVHLREIMKDSGYEVACGICYVESTRREFSTISEGFVEQYRKAQAEGTNIKKVNASGQTKDLTTSKGIENSDPNRFVYPEKGFTPTLADLVTAEGIDRLQAEHPEVYKAFNAYMNARGQQKPKMIETRTDYRGEILNMTKGQVSRRNSHGGLRIQSFSDFEVPHLIDMMQAVYDMASMGLKGQAYTKVPSFARAMGRTGIKINLSLIAKGDGVDANGKLIFDDVEGMPASEAFSIRNDPRFSENVGTILVGKNVKHIVTAMADPEIDFIIPFHKSSWSASLYKSLGLEGYEDFTDYQNEKKAGTKIENYDPAEYWDFSKTGDENAQIYLEKCRADGRTPKFAEVMYEGKSLTEYPGYWKLLIDYKMYNNDGVGAPQKAVKPVFDDAYNAKMLSEYKGGHGKLPVAHDIVDRFLKEKSEGSYSLMDTDSDGRELSAEQREYFFGSKVVDAEGRLKPVYHGSPAVFTEFSTDFMSQHGSSEGQGFYFTDYKPMAEGYQKDGGQLLEGYLDIKKPLSDSEITLTRAEVKKLLQAVDPTGDEVLVNYDPAGGIGYPSKTWYNRAMDATVKAAMEYSDSDSEILAEIANGGAGTGAVLEAARNTLGYDGYIVEGKYDNATVYVAFDSSQFKNIDNTAPTESKDIRYSLMEDAQYMADIDRVVSEATEKANDELKAAQAEVKNIRQQLADYRQQATAEAKNTAAWKEGEAKLIADLSEAQSKEKKARVLSSYMDEYNAISERYRGEVRATDSEALAQYNEKLSNLRSGFRGEMEKLAIEQGAFKRGEKAARDIYVPTSVNGQKVTRGTRTILEASQTPESMLEEHAKEILAGARGYEVISDKKAQEYAERIIDKEGYDKADELFTNAVNGDQVLDKKTLVLGEYLYMEAAKAGDVKNAMRYAADVAAAATRAGQVVQAMRVLKKATPTGKLYYLNRMVDTMNKNIVDNGGDPIQIDEGLARKLLEAENIKDPKEQGKAVDETIDEIEQNIADQIPATAWDKWNAWRYLSMLGNIRTQVRNIVGNAAFMPLVATKNLIAAGMEKAFIRNGGRTKSSFFTKTNVGKRLMEFGKKDFDTVVDEIQGGGKYNQSSSIEEKRTIFKSKAIEGWRKLTNKAMDKGDEIFSKHHYARALAGYLYANHLDYDKITRNTPQAQEVLNKARAYAILEAQKATFRDANQLAAFINKTKRNLLKKAQTAETKGAKAGWYVGTAVAEGIMPFTKTPIDILARGVEYSPIGLIKGIKEAVYDVKKGNKTAAEAIDTLSAGLTGTGIFALGYFLQSLGLLAGALDDDKESKYKKDRGAQGFAIHIGDKYYTIDWLAPFSLPLFTGAAVAETVENGDEVSFATLADVFSTISEPMLEMSMLQGVNSALSNGQYSSDSKIVSFMTNQITGYLSQANPTILGQIARAVDDTSRNAYYYDPNYKGFVQTGKVFGDKQIAKIPFASKALTSRIDLWGNKQENTGGSFFGRLAYNMLSPGYYSEESNDPVDVALTKLYEETEDTAVLPSKPSKTVTNNKTDYKMNAKQYEEFCIVKGQTAHKEIQTFINSSEYKKMSNDDRVDVLEHLYKYSTYKAQKNLLGNKYVASSTYSRCVKAEAYAKGGNPVYKYFLKG